MVGLNAINYKIPLLDEKANFFVDYFEYCNNLMGLVHSLEHESPLSLVEKILFQLTFNKKRPITKYLENHFRKLAAYAQSYLGSFSGANGIYIHLGQFNAANNKFGWVSANRNFLLADFKLLKGELERKMFNYSLNNIIRILKSSDPIVVVMDEIKFHTHILACEILFKRSDKGEVGKMFAQVFSDDYRVFPFPKHIAKKNAEVKKAYLKKHFKKFETPYRAIKYFFDKSESVKFILFKIDDLIFPDNYEFTFDNVTFCSIRNSRLSNLIFTIENHTSENFKKAFGDFPYTVVIVPVKETLRSIAFREAVSKVKTPLLYFNSTLNKTCIIDRFNYLFSFDLKEFGGNVSFRAEKDRLTEHDISKLTDNVYHHFKGKEFASKNKFLEYERTFIDARKTDDISSLWKYLENLTGIHPEKNGEVEWIKSLVAGSLLLDEKKYNEGLIERYLKNAIAPFNCGHSRLGITLEDQDLFISHGYKLKKNNPNVNSTFFTDALQGLHKRYTKQEYERIHCYYMSILTEAYEQRNLVTHSGIQHLKATVKLLNSFNSIVTRFRWAIFDYMKRNPRMSLKVIFEKIEKDFKSKLP